MRGVIATSIPGEWAGAAAAGAYPPPPFNPTPLSFLNETMLFGYPPAGDTLKTCAGDHAGHPSRVPGPAAAARPPPCSSRVMTRPALRDRTTQADQRAWPGAAAPGSALHRLLARTPGQ